MSNYYGSNGNIVTGAGSGDIFEEVFCGLESLVVPAGTSDSATTPTLTPSHVVEQEHHHHHPYRYGHYQVLKWFAKFSVNFWSSLVHFLDHLTTTRFLGSLREWQRNSLFNGGRRVSSKSPLLARAVEAVMSKETDYTWFKSFFKCWRLASKLDSYRTWIPTGTTWSRSPCQTTTMPR